MTVRLGVLMDPISKIKIGKDTTFGLLLEAQRRNWEIYYLEQADLWLRDGAAQARMQRLRVTDDPIKWYDLQPADNIDINQLTVLLMRKDPPFDMEYIHTTYLLERLAQQGVKIINHPQALRDANEKVFTAWFPHCTAPTLITRSMAELKKFTHDQQEIVVKPLDSMGGTSIFYVKSGDANASVIFEVMTDKERKFTIAQRFLPEIAQGDKRIILINGEPVPYALARVPAPGEFRGNLAAGGTGQGQPLSDRDRWLCTQVGPALKDRGLLFVGLDVIGDFITEINVTSPTGIRELDRQFGLNIAGQLFDALGYQ